MTRARSISKRVTRSRSKRSRKVTHSRNKTRRARKHMKGGCAQCFASM